MSKNIWDDDRDDEFNDDFDDLDTEHRPNYIETDDGLEEFEDDEVNEILRKLDEYGI